jgi:hypothetical protein
MNNLIAISGKIKSGKDTFLEYLEEYYSLAGKKSPFENKKFAHKLKATASLMLGYPVHYFEDQEFKNTLLPPEWNDEEGSMTVRRFLQQLGTDACRIGLHENVWVNALFSDYVTTRHEKNVITKYPELPHWVITDTRFPNEFEAVRARGGILIRVNRPCSECGGLGVHSPGCSIGENEHPSEHPLDTGYDFDYVINNDSNLKDYREACFELFRKILPLA